MKKRRFAAILMAAAMLFTTACTTAADEASKADTGSASKGIVKEDIKVGVIHIGNPADGSGYSYAHDLGIVEMQENLGLSDDQIVRKNNVADSDPTATETAINECIEEGCNVIFGTSYGYMDTMEKLAGEYPDIYFCHGTGYKNNGKNMNNYFGRIYQARYLSGIVAGLKTESNLIGYVSAMGQDHSECPGGIDATEETNAAKALISEGCDVIAQHCDTPNPQLEAESAGVWGVGYNSDMSKDAPGATLTSVIWNWGAYYTAQIQEIIDGKWDCENYFGGMAEGLLDISPLSENLCTEEMQAAVDEAKAKIVDGSFNIFDGVIETNDGTTVGEEGKTLDDATITGGINWYFKNVELK